MIAYLKLELKRLFRDGGYLIMSLATPLIMYLTFSHLKTAGDGDGVYSMVGLAGFGALGAALTNGAGLAEDRALGWLRQLRLMPLTPAQVVTARALTGMVVALPPILAVCAAGAFINGVELSPLRWVGIIGALWIGVAPIAALGLAVGYRLNAQPAQATSATAYMGLSLLGGLWVPLSQMPGWVSTVGHWTPTYRYADLGWRIADGHLPLPTGLGVIGLWAVVFTGLAIAAYRHGARTV
ncbi:ABC transporter permease [Nocardia tengchongensis]|uniref:ABC transporter permease n=1 Tax=Nocardia tengchongensis TaxID=2055889 RepID=UPI003673FAC2